MKFLSVCSGIEAASVAWSSLGWKAMGFSEIEPFPSAVLKHHYPDVPNYGDMTALPDAIRDELIDAPDLLCGGTPCQAFSVAGKRQSLDDARGNLTLTFCGIANAIDDVRRAAGEQPCVVFWENVPGVLNTKDNAFGCFLGELAGESCELKPAGGKWTNAGCVFGPERAIAWRVLDAQYFGVAQRRRRVFVVASARDGFDPAKILFEFEGVRRDSAPSREAGQSVAGATCAGAYLGNAEGGALDVPFMTASSQMRCVNNQTPLVAQPIPFDTTQITSPQNGSNPKAGDPCHPLAAGAHAPAVAQPIGVTLHGTDGTARVASFTETSSALRSRIPSGVENSTTTAVMQSMAVRRLTPVECERLQGFPDNYTNIPWRKADESPDGPRYKALGNSWAVPVVAWIGARIARGLA